MTPQVWIRINALRAEDALIRTRTIGGAVVEIGGRRITPSSELMFGLAVFLSAQRGQRVSRGTLVDMFWPRADALSARHSLRQMVYRLRQLGFALEEADDGFRIETAGVSCDLNDVLASTWPETADPEDLADRGDFLSGFNPEFSDLFRDWIDTQRSALHRQRRRALVHQLSVARKEGRWADVERWGQLILEIDPMSEEAVLACAESAAMMGSKLTALEILDRYVDELGERSSTLALPATMLRRRISERPKDWGAKSTAEVCLVGRSTEMRRLTDAVDSAREGHGRALLLFGAPGVGKTRLCAESRAYAALGGFRVLSAVADPSHTGRPLALVTRLAALLCEVPGVAACPPAAMSILRTVAEERETPLPFDPLSGGGLSLAQMAWALTEALRAASHECAVFVHLDDLHNSDHSSAAVLQSVANSIADARVILVATARSHWVKSEVLCQRGWHTIPRVQLAPLPLAASHELAVALGRAMGGRLDDHALAAIAREAGGNPLFLQELVSHGASGRTSGSRPLTLERVIEQRVSQLSSRETTILRIVVLLGGLATLPRLRSLLRGSDSILACDIEPLETDGLLHLTDTGALALHECWREAIDNGMTAGARGALALDCAEVLREGKEPAAVIEVCWHAAHLFSLGGDVRAARKCYTEAGERMLAIGVPGQASYAFTLAVSTSRDPLDLLSSLSMLASAQNAACAHIEAASTARRALEMPITDSVEHLGIRATLLAILADSEWKAHNAGAEVLEELAAIVTHPDLAPRERNLCCLLGIRVSYCHNGEWGKRFSDSAVVRGQSITDDWVAYTTKLIYEAEHGSAANVRTIAALLGSDELSQLPLQARLLVLRHRSMALRFIGEYREALTLAKEAANLALTSGLPEAATVCLSLGFAHMDNLEPHLAEEWIYRAQTLAKDSNYDERQRSLRHALGRLYLATGRYADCVALCKPALDSLMQDTTVHRKAVEASSFAHAAAADGEREIALRLISVAKPIVTSLEPGFQLDHAADSLVSALRLLGQTAEANEFLDNYMSRRSAAFARPIVPALTALRGRSVMEIN